MRRRAGIDHSDAKRLRFVFLRLYHSTIFRSLVRKQMPRRNPADGCDHEADSKKTATFHDSLPDPAPRSEFRPFPRSSSMYLVISKNIGRTASASNFGSVARRHHT